MNFSDINLDSAEVVEQELNSLFFNPEDYPTIGDLLSGTLHGQSREIYKPELSELSVNGRVVADKMETYLNKKANSSSALKEVITSPLNYYFYMNDKANFEEKRAPHFSLGTFCHSCFLEPENFEKVVVEPAYPQNANEGVEAMISFYENLIWDKYTYKGVAEKRINSAVQFCDDNGFDMGKIAGKRQYLQELKNVSGYTAIGQNDKLIIDLIKSRYYRYGGGIIPMLMRGALCEHSFYGKDPETGLPVKVRPDGFNLAENIGVDTVISFKTTSAQDLPKFFYDAAKYKYQLSEGYYQNVMSHITGRKFNTTVTVVLQTVAPYNVAVCFWNPEDLENGKYLSRHALDTIKECNEKGLFPGFEMFAESENMGIIDMALPEWSKKMLHPIDIDN